MGRQPPAEIFELEPDILRDSESVRVIIPEGRSYIALQDIQTKETVILSSGQIAQMVRLMEGRVLNAITREQLIYTSTSDQLQAALTDDLPLIKELITEENALWHGLRSCTQGHPPSKSKSKRVNPMYALMHNALLFTYSKLSELKKSL